MQVHHSRNLQCQVLVSDALLETSKQTEQNLQEYDGPQRKATVSICFVVFVYLCGITIHHLEGLRVCTELGALGPMKYIQDRMFFRARG